MKRFDCLTPLSPIHRSCLLEASAGTGKTFAVEHIFVRLLLEQALDLEQILVITFTRAATRELKKRIRSNIEKAIQQLQCGQVEWAYLQALEDRKEALDCLQTALGVFDCNQIFTIHGFCHRMLKEFGFEARCSISSRQSGEPRIQIPKKLQRGVRDFLMSLSEKILCAEQLQILLKKYQGIESLTDKLLRESKKDLGARPFEQFYDQYVERCIARPQPTEQVLEDFLALAKHYKAKVKGKFEEQIRALIASPEPLHFRFLLEEKGSLFDFLSPENQKMNAASTSLPPFLEWANQQIAPLIREATHPKKLFSLLASEWDLCAKQLMQQEELVDPDTILETMHEKIANPSFVQLVQSKYGAALIDEFQDTDALQWGIFSALFPPSQKLLFLVGDPKQSIYRFRKADIYTYLEAKSYFPPSDHYFLDTNFRSSPALIGALNHLFSRDWLYLPKQNSFLPYLPVNAGVQDAKPFPDQKGALHFFLSPKTEEALWSCIAREICQLQKEVASLQEIAILVKDRYQALSVASYLQQKGIKAAMKSHMPLGETFAFQALYELLQGLIDPKESRLKAILAGPFARLPLDQMPPQIPAIFYSLKIILEERGIAPFIRQLLSAVLHQQTVLEAIGQEDAAFYTDFFQAVELLLQWEREEGFSLEGLQRTLQTIALSQTHEDEQVRRRSIDDEDAVQVMTIHVSKGLEFDVVFAVGLMAKSAVEELDDEAETLRLLYVAMTRAKRRLYIPIAEEKSPIELFFQPLVKDCCLEEVLQEIDAVSWEIVQEQSVEVSLPKEPVCEIPSFALSRYEVQPRYLHSFTSLAAPCASVLPPLASQETLSIHTLPRGAEMGVLLHELLEDLFSSSYPLWRDPEQMREKIGWKMKKSRFPEWTEVVQNVLDRVVALPFLAELEPKDVRVEVEFLFEETPHFVKGFIDLLFRKGEELYLVDWKSNWLGETDEAYTDSALQQNMKEHEYPLQAKLYAEALTRAFPQLQFAGAYYIFLRGIYSPTQGIYFFQPRRTDGLLA